MTSRAQADDSEALLDTAIRGKELASSFFQSLAAAVEDLDLRQCFQRLSQEEWDHRKILLKHRRELFGKSSRVPVTVPSTAAEVFRALEGRPAIRHREDLRCALQAVIRSERHLHRFYDEASRTFDDRSVKVFLRILAEEGRAQVAQLMEAIQRIDASDAPLVRRRALARRN